MRSPRQWINLTALAAGFLLVLPVQVKVQPVALGTLLNFNGMKTLPSCLRFSIYPRII